MAKSNRWPWVVSLVVVLFAACDKAPVLSNGSGTGTAPVPAGSPAQPKQPLPQVAAAPVGPVNPPLGEQPQPFETPAVAPAPSLPAAAPAAPLAAATASSAPKIRLSTGVALAQTLPDGTGMLCSMEYQWLTGGPQPGTDYVWVIAMNGGERIAGPADVSKRSGTVQAVLRGVTPERGPFMGAVFIKNSILAVAPHQIADFINLR